MYLFVRHYRGSGDLDEVMRRIARGIVPLLRERPGFRGYWACQTAEGDAFTITLFEDRDGAVEGNAAVRSYVRLRFSDLLPEAPDIHNGPVQLSAHAEGAGRDGYAVVSLRRGMPSEAELSPRLRDVLVPVLLGLAGFRSYCAARVENAPWLGIDVTLWETQAQADLALARVAEVIRGDMAGMMPEPEARIRGVVHVGERGTGAPLAGQRPVAA